MWQYEKAELTAETSVALIIFNGILYHVCTYTLTISYRRSTWIRYQKSYILVSDSSQIEPVQNKNKYNFHTELFTVTRVLLIIRLKFSTMCHIIQYGVLLIMWSFWIHLIFFKHCIKIFRLWFLTELLHNYIYKLNFPKVATSNTIHGEVNSIQHYVTKFVSD